MLSIAAQNHTLSSLSPNNDMGSLLNLQYADDTLLFVRTGIDSLGTLKLLLYIIELASGLKINFNKSLVYHLDDNNDAHDQAAHMLNCKKGQFPLNYLGIPLSLIPTKLQHKDWQPLINKVDRRLAS